MTSRSESLGVMRLVLDVDPASLPTAQQKGVTRRGRVYTKAKVLRAKETLVRAIRDAFFGDRYKVCVADFGRGPLAATPGRSLPWEVAIEYVYGLRSTPVFQEGYPKVTRPDLDNLTKLVLDSLTASCCFFVDDAQVVSLATLKRHARASEACGERAHITLFIRPLAPFELFGYAESWRDRNGTIA